MTRSHALRILHLPEDATQKQIEESYCQLRAFYYPGYYGRPHEFTPQQIQEHLYEDFSRNYYKEPKGVQYKNFVPDAYHHALLSYARICRAYDYLTDPENQNEFHVDPHTPYGYDVLHYGKTVANIRKVLTKLACLLTKPTLITFIVSGVIGVMCNNDTNIFTIISQVAKILYFVLLGGACLAMPLDMLLVVPKKIWEGMRQGAGMGPWITKPITIVLFGGLGGLVGVLQLFLSPSAAAEDRELRYAPPIKNEKKAREAAAKLYQKTKENIANLGKDEEYCYIDDDIPCIRKELEWLAEKYKRAQLALRYAKNSGDADVERAGKNLDLEVKFIQWDIDDACDNYSKALRERDREVESKERELRIAERIFTAFAYRVNADPEDYIDMEAF